MMLSSKRSTVVAWPNSNGVGRINEVTLRRARLVLGWVTVRGYTVLVCSQPLRPTQHSTLSGTGNEYWLRGSGRALR